ncbi:MAG TPA: PPOX class F420-dependent oxidoreductase [Acidimicrobiales bacterium]|nr:PPOX class F420-dependent oxidoreductase [Acidimicrobiales bacterium]
MPYHAMDEAELRAFLRDPVRPAVLATTRADGRPHAAPVWYDLDDGGAIVFNTGVNTVKGRNLRRTGRAAVVVHDDRPPYSFVVITGTATWSDDLDEVRTWAARIGGRYMGADRAEEYGARNGVPGELVVRVTPTHVVAEAEVAD